MNIKFYIGTELTDFNEAFNVMYSIGDIRDISFGNSNKSYTLDLPLTKQNKRLLKFISQADVKSEPSGKGRLYLGEQLIMQGAVTVSDYTDHFAKVILNSDDWIDELSNKKMTALDLSAHDHLLTQAVVVNSWTAAYPFYRYPMINFGALASGETGTTAKWYLNDFIPMFSVSQLITKIFSPYTISSAWLATAFIKDLYILAREKIAKDDFIQNRALEVNVQLSIDNEQSGTSSSSINVQWGMDVKFATTVKDEASRWIGDYWAIPETGTYKFKTSLKLSNTGYGNANLTITDETVLITVLCGAATIATIEASAYTNTELIHDVVYALETLYFHAVIGDHIVVHIYSTCHATVNAGTQTVVLSTQPIVSTFENSWGNANRYSGLNKNISAEEMMPDISQLDFLSAIRDIFNLRFFLDKFRQVLYIEPWDQFLSSTVIDLTEFIDFESIEPELISKNYNKKIIFKWKDDISDFAYTEYLKTATSPGQKELTLDSIYTKAGTETREHPFSSIINGYNFIILNYFNTPKIWKEEISPGATVFDRLANFNTRIVEWKGLTAGFTWYLGPDTKTTYPKIQGLDYLDATNPIYAKYLMKFFHYIDKGKLFTMRMKLKPGMLTEFLTVVSSSSNEGFRPTYKIRINNIDNYFALQKITSDGERAELELILKQ